MFGGWRESTFLSIEPFETGVVVSDVLFVLFGGQAGRDIVLKWEYL